MNKIKYLENYFNEIRQLIKFDKNKINDLIKTSEILIQANRLKKKNFDIWKWRQRRYSKSF